jgi:hypothetical protein
MAIQEVVTYQDNANGITITNLQLRRYTLIINNSQIISTWIRKARRNFIAGCIGWLMFISFAFYFCFSASFAILTANGIPIDVFNIFSYNGKSFAPLAFGGGALFAAGIILIAILILFLSRGKYQVMIDTGWGTDIFVESHDKSYILKIKQEIEKVTKH